MKKARIEGATHNPGAPKNWDPEKDGPCGSLPIVFDVEMNCCYSAWKPSAEELTVLMNGGYVVLCVAGWQVPVSLHVVDHTKAQEIE